jgi:CheY-like chemotaxis protein
MEKKNWAIVDDDLIFHLTTEALIERKNADKNIFFFKNGKEAIDYLEKNIDSVKNLPDVILLDLKMPVMDGWDFIDKYLPLRSELPRDITVYIVSSSVDNKDIERAKEISAIKEYIVKPMDQYKLTQIIDELKAA